MQNRGRCGINPETSGPDNNNRGPAQTDAMFWMPHAVQYARKMRCYIPKRLPPWPAPLACPPRHPPSPPPSPPPLASPRLTTQTDCQGPGHV